MAIVITWNPGTPLGDLSGANPGGPVSYELEGTLTSRADDLAEAIEKEVGFGAGTVTVQGTDVIVDGAPRMTLSESTNGLDAPTNAWFARHLWHLLKHARGDRRTLFWLTLKGLARIFRHRLNLGRSAWLTVCGRAYDAVAGAKSDGD